MLAGTQVLGTYYVLYACFALISIFDFGIPNALISYISKMKLIQGKQILLKTTIILSFLSFFCLISFILVVQIIWFELLNKDKIFSIISSGDIYLICVLGLINNIGNLGLKYKSAIGKYSFTVYFETFTVLFSVVITICLLHVNPSVITLVIGLIGIPTLFSLIHLIRLLIELKPRINSYSSSRTLITHALEMLREGKLYLILQITTVVSLQVDNLVIGSFLGPSEVTQIGVTWKIFSVPYLLLVSASGGLWAYASMSNSELSSQRLKELILRNIRIAFYYSIFFGIIILLFGKYLVKRFSSNLQLPSYSMLIISSALLICMCVAQPIAMVLNGLRKEKFLIVSSTIGMCVNIGLSVLFVNLINKGYGALLGTIVAQVFCFIIPAIYVYIS
jgi:O-antigen/teichoic acid export membrane protein